MYKVGANPSLPHQGKIGGYTRQAPCAALIGKAANFVQRAFFGSCGALAPLTIGALYSQHIAKIALTEEALAETALEVALMSAGLGVFAAAVTNSRDQAVARGIQFGTVAQTVMLTGGVGKGTVLNSAMQLKNQTGELANHGMGAAGEWVKPYYGNLTAWTQEREVQLCAWSNNGTIANWMGCPDPIVAS